MKYLTPTSEQQTLQVIPRVYTTGVSISLRDDTSDEIVFLYPDADINGNYLDLTTSFTLVEGRYYDLKVYSIDYALRVLDAKGTIESVGCLGSDTDKSIIYRDKIFCTSQAINQLNNQYYSVNGTANQFIELWAKG